MTTALSPMLRDRLKATESVIRDLRTERAGLATEREQTRSALAAVDAAAGALTETVEYKKAKGASDRLAAHDDVLHKAQDEQTAILRLLSGASDTNVSLAAGDGLQREAVKAITSRPGALLATVLERRKVDVPTLPDDLRFKVAPTAITTAQVSTITESEAFIDLLAPRSVALASGIDLLRIDTTKTRLPRFTELPVAAWIAERAAFPQNGPGMELVDMDPNKVGLVTPLSIEVFEDLTPLGLAMIQTQLLRAVGLAFDAGILFGDGTGSTPRGVANTSGVVVVTAPLTGLAPFAESIAALIGNNAVPQAVVMNPLDLGTMLSLTEFSGASNSNVPLWKDAITSAANGTFSLTLPYFGTPIWPSAACPQGTALLYDPSCIIAVVRREADIALDPYWGFGTGEVALRTYLRGDVLVGQAGGVVKITFA
jgi:HK97 family phage major capsid protein